MKPRWLVVLEYVEGVLSDYKYGIGVALGYAFMVLVCYLPAGGLCFIVGRESLGWPLAAFLALGLVRKVVQIVDGTVKKGNK